MPLTTDSLKALVAALDELETSGLDVSADLASPLVFLQSRRGKAVRELAIQQQVSGVPDDVVKDWLAQAFSRIVESDCRARTDVILCARRLRVLLKRELAKVPISQPDSRGEQHRPRRAKRA